MSGAQPRLESRVKRSRPRNPLGLFVASRVSPAGRFFKMSTVCCLQCPARRYQLTPQIGALNRIVGASDAAFLTLIGLLPLPSFRRRFYRPVTSFSVFSPFPSLPRVWSHPWWMGEGERQRNVSAAPTFRPTITECLELGRPIQKRPKTGAHSPFSRRVIFVLKRREAHSPFAR